jgi:uncharacterized protein (DUF924 family)
MSAETNDDWVDRVIRYWFEELTPQDWFTKNDAVDAAIRSRFGALHERLQSVPLQELTTPLACLAAVIVLDQFPRNMFRGSPRAYATDALARSIAERAVAAGFDRQLEGKRRLFLYMPFQHSEEKAAQARAMELFGALDDAESLDYARQHQEIIDRFGRFPHRNAALGRESSAEEIEFMKTHRGF